MVLILIILLNKFIGEIGKYERIGNMDQELLKFAISQGLFAALFVWLLIDTRKESKTREESLNKTIEENKKRLWI